VEAGSIFAVQGLSLDILDEGPCDSPLYQRAWATQEWILSRRILHFTKAGLTWSCKALGFHGINETGEVVTLRNFWDPNA
jgi:hypothetical protein